MEGTQSYLHNLLGIWLPQKRRIRHVSQKFLIASLHLNNALLSKKPLLGMPSKGFE